MFCSLFPVTSYFGQLIMEKTQLDFESKEVVSKVMSHENQGNKEKSFQ